MRLPSLCSWAAQPSWLLLLLLGSACSSSTDERRTITSTPEEYCRTACNKAHVCMDTIDAAECRSACQTELAAQPDLRADFLAYIASCLESSSCSNTSGSKCTSEAQAQLSPSSYGRTFCTAYLTAGAECDASGATYSEASCFEAAKSYDDSALKAANDCLTKSCADLSACLAQAIPDFPLPP